MEDYECKLREFFKLDFQAKQDIVKIAASRCNGTDPHA